MNNQIIELKLKCEICNKSQPTAFLNGEKVCSECYDKYKINHRKQLRSFICVICKKNFTSRLNPKIPACCEKCRVKIKKGMLIDG